MTGWRWHGVRALFLIAVVWGGWASLRGAEAEIAAAIGNTSIVSLLGALVLTLGGVAVTGRVWRQALETLSPVADPAAAYSVFFIGQLGKYIPGSVWSFGAQAVLAKEAGIVPRLAVTASALFLGVHVASGLIVAGVVGGPHGLDWWSRALLVLGGSLAFIPAVVRRVGLRLASSSSSWTMGSSLVAATSMCIAWVGYSGALALLVGSSNPNDFRVLMTAFCMAHAAGALVPVAPAGLGAREVVFVALLAPTFGTSSAAALAILARLVQTAADLLVAALAWAAKDHCRWALSRFRT